VERLLRIAFAALCLLSAGSATAATFGELASWCAPEDAGGRPGLCVNYLQTYLEALRTDDASLNDGVRACVPESADHDELVQLIRAYAREHPDAATRSGVAGTGEALKTRFPCG
jgi:Rap1a immunity proteins